MSKHLLPLAVSLLLLQFRSPCFALPHNGHQGIQDVVLVEEIVRLGATATQNNASATLITLSESSGEDGDASSSTSSQEVQLSDDLIFLAHKSLQQQQQEANKQQHGIDVLTSDEEHSLHTHSEEEAATSASNATPIDMSAFVALIPLLEVKAIANNYYRHDAEVQRAYAFLSSSHFAEMKQQLVQLPEVRALTRYLNSSGLDVVRLMQSLIRASSPTELDGGNEIAATPTAMNMNMNMNSDAGEAQETSTKEQLNGLHGLVDSILDVLPQDQILATFFDKMEADEQFAHLVDSIGTPTFARILSNLQSSVPLRNLIFVLHNNGIYITRIVDSLKSYFFLASF